MNTRENHPGDLYRLAAVQLQEVRDRFPAQFEDQQARCKWPCGWHSIVLQVCEYIEATGLEITWIEIKEKLGGLRMVPNLSAVVPIHTIEGSTSTYYCPDEVPSLKPHRDFIKHAEQASHKVCARCGKAGQTRAVAGWIITACDACTELIGQLRRVPHN